MATLKNTTINDTGYIQLPAGNTAQRPSAANGMMRYNTDNSKVEIYTGGAWNILDLTGDPTDVYAGAAVYAPLSNSQIYSIGSLSSDTVEIAAYGSYGADELNSALTVLKMSGGAQTRIPGGNPGSSHTISVWYRSSSGSDYGMLFSKYPSVGTSSYGVDIWDGNGNGAIYLNTGDGSANPFSGSSGHYFNHTDWRHYCFTFDGSTARYYRNGSLVGAAPTYRTFSGYTGQWTIGTWSGQYFGQYTLSAGRFRKFAVWHGSALSATDVTALYNAGL